MKIKRFESNENTCTEKEFLDFITIRRKIYGLLSEYMRLNPDILIQKKIRQNQSITIVSYDVYDNCIDLDYYIDYPESENTISLGKEEYSDLLLFMENPSQYADSKKYNI